MEFFKYLVLAALGLFAPIKALILTVLVLIFADLFLGIWAARKRGEKITSAAMRRTVTKLLVYNTTIITGFLVETYLLGGIAPISKLVAAVVGAVEMKSLLENASEITGLDFKSIIKALGSKNDL